MRWAILSIFVLHLTTGSARAVLSDVTHQTMEEVVRIARAIAAVQPYLDDTKLMEYGLGIYRASRRYDIDPMVLIAITQQETGFRDNLPEGKAGEIGICQIRKNWLKHPEFAREFNRPTIKDLKRPAKSFMMAAWILRDLKSRPHSSKTIPYWSYYNAVRFENRFKYFLAVNKKLSVLRRHVERELAAGTDPLPDAAPSRPVTKTMPVVAKDEAATTARKPATSGRWISDALDKLEDQRRNGGGRTGSTGTDPNLLRAQSELLGGEAQTVAD